MIEKVTWVDLEHSHFEVSILSEQRVVGGASHVNNRGAGFPAFPPGEVWSQPMRVLSKTSEYLGVSYIYIFIYTVISIRSSFNISKCQSECFHQV